MEEIMQYLGWVMQLILWLWLQWALRQGIPS